MPTYEELKKMFPNVLLHADRVKAHERFWVLRNQAQDNWFHSRIRELVLIPPGSVKYYGKWAEHKGDNLLW